MCRAMNANEKQVLMAMLDGGGDYYYAFAALTAETQLDRKAVRRACRSLARKGLTKFRSGLWNEDGEPCGSGYALTPNGIIDACALVTARVTPLRQKQKLNNMNKPQVLELLRLACDSSGSIRAWARDNGFSAPYVSDVLLERRTLSPRILGKLGLTAEKREPVYRRKR